MPKTISVRVDDDLHQQLDIVTEQVKYDIPKSEIIRTALREHIDETMDRKTSA